MNSQALTTQSDNKLVDVLINSLYPGAAKESALMVIEYCRQAGLDVMQKPVHIVPMWDSKQGSMRDVVMPGISLYRINAARTKEYGGMSEPEFGEDVTENIGGVTITYPKWCKVSVSRIVAGMLVTFPAKELWKENYAAKGGKEKSIAPNAMWAKRPYAQLAKCAEAQALRKAFPESCPAHTAEEMEGKQMLERDDSVISSGPAVVFISDAQLAELKNALHEKGITEEKACGKLRVAALAYLEADRFDAAMAMAANTKGAASVAA